MTRKAAALVLLAGLAGVAHAGKFMAGHWTPGPDGASTGARYYANAPGYVGPYGAPVHAINTGGLGTGKYSAGEEYARMMLSKTMPPSMLQQVNYQTGAGSGQGPAPQGYPGMPGPGGLPGGPLVSPQIPVGAVAGVGMLTGQQATQGPSRTQIRFVRPSGMKISWYAPKGDGKPGFTKEYLEAPARYNFLQASIYRLKLSDIPNRPGVELYPTLEVVPSNNKTATFLAHSAVPVGFTEEDLEQVAAGNFVVKVIYLPDPAHQDLAATGPDEVVSSRLEPGVDPIIEARRRGSILAVVRLGNNDLEAPNTPAMDAPDPAAPKGPPAGAMVPGMMPPGMGMMPPGMGMMGPGMGMMPPGMGMMPPPGMMPPGMMPPGMMPPGMVPGAPKAGATGSPMGTTPVSKATSKPTGTSILPVGFFAPKK
jgi:hypothetical protein